MTRLSWPVSRLATAGVLAGAIACARANDDTSSAEGADTASEGDYDFQLPEEGDQLVRVDAMGVALISTVLMNRDRTPTGADNQNQYQIDTPDVQNNPKTLKGFVHYLRALHEYWADSLAKLGFQPCSEKPLGITLAGPCALQQLHFDEDANEVGPRVIDVILPDAVALDFDLPLRFPNGRTPWEPISDKIFALGFLKMGGNCSGVDQIEGVPEDTKSRVPRDPTTRAPICTIETLADIQLQVPTNDRPFFQDTFPYLAKPWFYAEQDAAKTTYFWPTTARLGKPE
jgi:hypothetical protein